MGVSGHSRKTLAGASHGERTFRAAAHPADAWLRDKADNMYQSMGGSPLPVLFLSLAGIFVHAEDRLGVGA